jgi:hypothetical protein
MIFSQKNCNIIQNPVLAVSFDKIRTNRYFSSLPRTCCGGIYFYFRVCFLLTISSVTGNGINVPNPVNYEVPQFSGFSSKAPDFKIIWAEV